MDLPDVDPRYTAMCREKTLQEEQRGFFAELVAGFGADAAVADWSQAAWAEGVYGRRYYESLARDEHMLARLTETFAVRPAFRRKSAEKAAKALVMATKEAAAGDHKKAIAFCNQAVIISPAADNIESSLTAALWIRSEHLMKTNSFDLALRDLQAASKMNFPSDQRHVLFHRQGLCYKEVGEIGRAKISLQLAAKLAPQNSELRNTLKKDIDGLKELKNGTVKDSKQSESSDENLKASSIIGVEQNYGTGRYAVAKRDIAVGETIVQEQPYAACLKHTSFGTHCHNCFERLQAPYGCPRCANLAFCSPECRDHALSTYHKYECSYMDLFIGSGMSVLCNLALRMITQNGLEKSLEIYERYLAPREKLASFDDQQSEVDLNDRLHVMYNLCTHTGQRTHDDYLSRALMAFFLFGCLKDAGFFGDGGQRTKLTDSELKIVTMLLYHVQMLHFNAHEIEELQRAETQKSGNYKFKAIAVGIYPVVSLFNHDCHQGVARYFSGKSIVMKAIKPIAIGEMIPENYGPIFTKHAKYARQRILRSRYWFMCGCMSCTEIWPSLEQMPAEMTPVFRCPDNACSGKLYFENMKDGSKCSTCESFVESKVLEVMSHDINTKCIKKYEEADKMINDQKYQEAAVVLREALDQFYKIASPPFSKTHQAEQKLKTCFILCQ